jgi:hypothetical protein
MKNLPPYTLAGFNLTTRGSNAFCWKMVEIAYSSKIGHAGQAYRSSLSMIHLDECSEVGS